MQFTSGRATRITVTMAGAAALAVLAAGCGQQSGVSVTQTASAPRHMSYSVTIVNGGQKSHPDWPYFSPGNMTLPANTTVTVTIKNEDNGADSVPASLAKVTGTVGGTETVNGKTVTAIAVKDVSHTLTVPGLGINIPIPPLSTVTFTIQTKGPGTYVWQCMVPCGTGSSGWGGPMATMQWMKGSFTIR